MIEQRKRGGGVMRTGHYVFVAAVGVVAVIVGFVVLSAVVGIVFEIIKIIVIAAIIVAVFRVASRLARRH